MCNFDRMNDSKWFLFENLCKKIQRVASFFRVLPSQPMLKLWMIVNDGFTLLCLPLVTIWLITFEKGQISSVVANWRIAATVGFSGWIASICWFTAFTLTNAAYVRALGQVELIFTFLVSVLFFKEKITRAEIGGAVLLASGIVILILERVS